VPETKDILAVFPSLKRIELLEGPQTDLYKYLTEHVETPLEYVRKQRIFPYLVISNYVWRNRFVS
jgi:hypothetical protein